VSESEIKTECRTEEVAAYLDGEMEPSEHLLFENHLEDCSRCAFELREQKRFLCELDVALNHEPSPALPHNFVEVVAAHAQSDMRGVMSANERSRALLLCLLLAAASLAVLGSTALELVGSFLRPVGSVAGFAWRGLYEAGAGATIVYRSLGSHLILESTGVGLIAVFCLVIAAVLLPRLICRYHRAQS
jgi:predicted anti-sigma-YlaC factor YlaD